MCAYINIKVYLSSGGVSLILTAHQPAYLPWLGFFHKIAISDTFILLDEVQFEKNSFINRNKIKTPNGSLWLTIPIHKTDYMNKSILKLEIDNSIDWSKKHWNNLLANYKKAPFFHEHSDFFLSIYEKKWIYLTDIITPILDYLLKELKIQTKIIKQSELKTTEKKQQLIIELCKKTNSDKFVFGTLGRNYAVEDTFNDKGIQIYFQQYKHPIYTQRFGQFMPYMSILDLLFNVGSDAAYQIIMKDNINKNDLQEIFASKKI